MQKTKVHLASYHRRWQTQAPGREGGGGRVWRVLISTLDLHSARFKIEEVHGGELARTATAKTVGRSAGEVSMLTLPMISMCPRVEEDGGDGCGVWSGWLDEEPANLEPHLTVSRGLGLSLGLPGLGLVENCN